MDSARRPSGTVTVRSVTTRSNARARRDDTKVRHSTSDAVVPVPPVASAAATVRSRSGQRQSHDQQPTITSNPSPLPAVAAAAAQPVVRPTVALSNSDPAVYLTPNSNSNNSSNSSNEINTNTTTTNATTNAITNAITNATTATTNTNTNTNTNSVNTTNTSTTSTTATTNDDDSTSINTRTSLIPNVRLQSSATASSQTTRRPRNVPSSRTRSRNRRPRTSNSNSIDDDASLTSATTLCSSAVSTASLESTQPGAFGVTAQGEQSTNAVDATGRRIQDASVHRDDIEALSYQVPTIRAHLVTANTQRDEETSSVASALEQLQQLQQTMENVTSALRESGRDQEQQQQQQQGRSQRQTRDGATRDARRRTKHQRTQKSVLYSRCSMIALFFLCLAIGAIAIIVLLILRPDDDNPKQLNGNEATQFPTTSPPTPAPLLPVPLQFADLASELLPNIQDNDDWRDPTTIQYQALWWMLYSDPSQMAIAYMDVVKGNATTVSDTASATTSSPVTDGEVLDRFVMVCLYIQTAGASWTRNVRWLTGESVCRWHGIVCLASSNGQDHDEVINNDTAVAVTTLSTNVFSENNLNDAAAVSRTNNENSGRKIDRIDEIHLSVNNLLSRIPTEIGLLDTHLKTISIQNNNLAGTLPTTFGMMHRLSHLTITANLLEGKIPTEFGMCSSIVQIGLGDNKINGPIPSELGKLEKLKEISLNSNLLSGELPSELGQVTTLTRIDLWGNALTGTVPTEWNQLTSLTKLWLEVNDITGSLEDIFCTPSFLNRTLPFERLKSSCGGVNPRIICSCCTHCCDGDENC